MRHPKEGRVTLAVLERARDFTLRSGQPFAVALRCTRTGNVFTTHAPVDAGLDRFTPELMARYFGEIPANPAIGLDELLDLGGLNAGKDDGSIRWNGPSRPRSSVADQTILRALKVFVDQDVEGATISSSEP